MSFLQALPLSLLHLRVVLWSCRFPPGSALIQLALLLLSVARRCTPPVHLGSLHNTDHQPPPTSQMYTLRSVEPDRMCVPSGLHPALT